MRRLALALSLVALAGCVTQDTFRKKELEANKLRQDWMSEQTRRLELQARFEAVQAQLDTIALDVSSLKEKVRADEGTLAQKEAELRATQAKVVDLTALVEELSTSKKKLEVAKAELEKKSTEYARLAGALRSEIEAGRVELTELRGRTTVKLKDKILFASGSSTIGAEGRDAIRKVAGALQGLQGKTLRIEGHTDDVPTAAGGAFPTNWELSSARALAVVRLLQESGVDPTRMAAAGYASYQPVAPNDSPEGRSQNRRIEIVLVPAEGAVPIAQVVGTDADPASAEPVKAAPVKAAPAKKKPGKM